ncbi:MAG: translation elongation factor-like protein [Patescibacteria group bacterium]
MEQKLVGKISRYFPKIMVAVLDVSDKIRVGDNVKIKGATTDFDQIVSSMQVEHSQIEEVGVGMQVGFKVDQTVEPGDEVYLLV